MKSGKAFLGMLAILVLWLGGPSISRADLVHPESGVWWNPNASGSGLQVEIQDDIIALTFFGYDARGQGTFYVMAGVFDAVNKRFTGNLDGFTNGPCIGCPYNPPVAVRLGVGGAQFISRSRAVLTLPVAGGGSVTTPIERYSFGLGGTPEQQQLGAWFTTIVYSTGLPEGDLVVIERTAVDSQGPFVVGRLYPTGAPVVGEFVSIPGSRLNFFWQIALNSTQDAYYAGEMSLQGIVGFFAVYPRGGQPPASGIPAFGARLVGIKSIAQALPTSSAVSEDGAADQGKRRASLAEQAEGKVLSTPELAALADIAARASARLERARADQ